MDAWLFSGADRFHALTADEDGDCLPSDLGPWQKLRSITLAADLPDEREAINLISEHGFCCFE